MRGKNTLVINGKVYDAVTGLPVAAPDAVRIMTKPIVTPVAAAAPMSTVVNPAVHARTPHHAKQAHRVTQRSSTLRRDVLKKPVAKTQVGAARRKPAPGHVARSEAIQRFAPHPQPLKTVARKPTNVRLDITPVKAKPATSAIVSQKHALVTKAAPVKAPVQLSSRALKEQLIAERLAKVDTTPSKTKAPKNRSRLFSRQPRVASMIAVSLAIMVLGGYLTYLNMPGLSVRVAAAQADVAATFPDYHPDGYRFNGPVAYAPGQVAIDFRANGGTTGYTVTEQKSTWDSQAVYDNIVAKAADDSYVTNSQQGLTIYTFKGDAAWVNKGILYTVHGDAPLSNEQLLRIAGSL